MRLGGVNLSGVPLLPVLAGLVAGEVFAFLCSGFVFYGAALCAALCFVAILLRRFHAALWCAFTFSGIIAMWIALPRPCLFTGENELLSGRVTEISVRPESQRIVADLNSADRTVAARCVVYYMSSEPPVETGDIIAVSGVIEPPYLPQAVEGEFTLRQFAERRGISARMRVPGGDLSVVEEASGFMHRMRMTRRHISEALFRSGVRGETAALADALLTGDDSWLASDLRADFSRAGIAHMLALSGTHVAVIAFFASLLFFPLRLAGHRKMALGGVVVCLWLYAVITGASPSVVRAVVMATVVALAAIAGRGHNPFNSLCCAAVIILLFDPMALFAPGFQMSFLAVAGIIMFASRLTFGRGYFRSVSGWLGMTAGAVVAVSPVVAWHFHLFPFYFLLSGMAVAVAFPAFMGLAVLALVTALCGSEIAWVTELTDAFGRFLTAVPSAVSHLPGAYADRIYFSPWALVPCYAAVIAAWRALRTRRLFFAAVSFLLLLFSVGLVRLTRPVFPECEVIDLTEAWHGGLLVRDGARCVVFTGAAHKHHASIKEQMEWRLAGYMDMRGIDSLEVRQMAGPFGEIGRVIVGGAHNGAVPHHKVDVDGNPVGE